MPSIKNVPPQYKCSTWNILRGRRGTFDNLDIENCRITLEADETKGKKERVVNFEEKTFNYLIE